MIDRSIDKSKIDQYTFFIIVVQVRKSQIDLHSIYLSIDLSHCGGETLRIFRSFRNLGG